MPEKMRANTIDGVNRPAVKEVIKILKKDTIPRGEWILCQVFDAIRIGEIGNTSVSQNAGYLIYKDRSILTFYTNDVAKTLDKRINYPSDTKTIECVYGSAPFPGG